MSSIRKVPRTNTFRRNLTRENKRPVQRLHRRRHERNCNSHGRGETISKCVPGQKFKRNSFRTLSYLCILMWSHADRSLFCVNNGRNIWYSVRKLVASGNPVVFLYRWIELQVYVFSKSRTYSNMYCLSSVAAKSV